VIELLRPDMVARSVFDVDLNQLKQKGISGLIMDMDNTLLGWDHNQVSKEIKRWVESAQAKGFAMCITSNGYESRVQQIAMSLGIPAVSGGIKPRKKPFRKALEILKLPPSQVAVIGDQLFTDVLGGNRMDLFTILINPVSQKELKSTQMVRKVESRMIKRLHKKGLLTSHQFGVRTKKY
jgi:HAD superfamily phosphatase (TIGR01668 family)